MVELCHFLSFSDLSERNYNSQSFWITLYHLDKEHHCCVDRGIDAMPENSVKWKLQTDFQKSMNKFNRSMMTGRPVLQSAKKNQTQIKHRHLVTVFYL